MERLLTSHSQISVSELWDKAQKQGFTWQATNLIRQNKIALSGRFFGDNYPGFELRACDCNEQANFTVKSQSPVCLLLCLVLEGEIQFALDGKQFAVSSGLKAQALLVNVTKVCEFQRHLVQGRRIKKINISIEQDWLKQQMGELLESETDLLPLLDGHLATQTFTASEELQALAQQLFMAEAAAKPLQNLRLQSHSMVLMEAFLTEVLNQGRSKFSGQNSKASGLISEVERILSSSQTKELELPQLAAMTGKSISQLQRSFKQRYGKTVMAYYRQQKLLQMKRALELGEVSVGQAAYMSGYNHRANFDTAFRREFGFPPGQCSKPKA